MTVKLESETYPDTQQSVRRLPALERHVECVEDPVPVDALAHRPAPLPA